MLCQPFTEAVSQLDLKSQMKLCLSTVAQLLPEDPIEPVTFGNISNVMVIYMNKVIQ